MMAMMHRPARDRQGQIGSHLAVPERDLDVAGLHGGVLP